ncbi:hypothetical protein GBA52_026210 [Prunus armeniaca]|nr:hypothetical protein GBA52_026210 [Prunus armeniaca]
MTQERRITQKGENTKPQTPNQFVHKCKSIISRSLTCAYSTAKNSQLKRNRRRGRILVKIWDLMGFGKQRISTIRSRMHKRKLNLNCEYEMIWDAEGSMHLVVGTCDDSLLRLIVEDEKKIDQIKKCLWRFGRKHVDSNM